MSENELWDMAKTIMGNGFSQSTIQRMVNLLREMQSSEGIIYPLDAVLLTNLVIAIKDDYANRTTEL